MRGARLEQANIIAKRRLKLKMDKWEDRELDKPNEGKWAWGAKTLCRLETHWFGWQLGSMDCAHGPNSAAIGRLRRHQRLSSKRRPKKGQPRMRGERWDYDYTRYFRRRMEREVCLGFITGRIEIDGDWYIDDKKR
jgi:hypothetical protein